MGRSVPSRPRGALEEQNRTAPRQDQPCAGCKPAHRMRCRHAHPTRIRRLWAVHTHRHSARTFSRLRNRDRRNSITCLITPNGNSATHGRCRYTSRSASWCAFSTIAPRSGFFPLLRIRRFLLRFRNLLQSLAVRIIQRCHSMWDALWLVRRESPWRAITISCAGPPVKTRGAASTWTTRLSPPPQQSRYGPQRRRHPAVVLLDEHGHLVIEGGVVELAG